MSGQSFRDLIAWQKAMDLVERVYGETHRWPREELYGLTNQARRAVVSVPANIAEGQGRSSDKEFLYYLSVAIGSLYEIQTHLLIAQRLRYSNEEQIEGLLHDSAEVGRLIHGLIRSFRQSVIKPTAPV